MRALLMVKKIEKIKIEVSTISMSGGYNSTFYAASFSITPNRKMILRELNLGNYISINLVNGSNVGALVYSGGRENINLEMNANQTYGFSVPYGYGAYGPRGGTPITNSNYYTVSGVPGTVVCVPQAIDITIELL